MKTENSSSRLQDRVAMARTDTRVENEKNIGRQHSSRLGYSSSGKAEAAGSLEELYKQEELKTKKRLLRRKEQDDSSGISDDPVRLYLREMGRVSLLDRQAEVSLAQVIDRGRRKIKRLFSIARFLINCFWKKEKESSRTAWQSRILSIATWLTGKAPGSASGKNSGS